MIPSRMKVREGFLFYGDVLCIYSGSGVMAAYQLNKYNLVKGYLQQLKKEAGDAGSSPAARLNGV